MNWRDRPEENVGATEGETFENEKEKGYHTTA
jgi:hypothetical protein